jgi:hypothetical protein
MTVGVCYLEAEDEVTSALHRIRAVRDDQIVIVVPPGSRIATSRINFKLLAREAAERNLAAVAVSDEPQVRALAVSAGLPAYDSLAAAQEALSARSRPDDGGVHGVDREAGDRPWAATRVMPVQDSDVPLGKRARVPDETAVLGGATAPAGSTEASVGPGVARSGRRRRGRRRPSIAVLASTGLIAVLVAGVAYGAWVFLPTASIALRPAAVEVRPSVFTVTADPDVAVVDPDAGVIPAEVLTVPLHVEGEFPATGIVAREIRAIGTVRFRSENTVEAVDVPSGTVLSTPDGAEFETTRDVTVPRADFATSTPGTADVAVRAVQPGPRGNVAAGEITVVPDSLGAQLISVRNNAATSGGDRIEETVVSQQDFDAAFGSLSAQLDAALATAVADPANVPRGLVTFAEAASVSAPQPRPTAAEIVETAAQTFALALDADANVVAVNESLIADIGAARVRAQLPHGHEIVSDEVVVTHDGGTVVGASVAYNVSASAWSFAQPDTAQVLAQVRGRSVSEARQLLSQYGEADISVWPEFVDRLPDQSSRISLTVEPPPVAR